MAGGGKAAQVLHIDPPSELVFKGPFTDVVTSYLELSNPSDRQVCFKVKTTAPKQYCVRPNSGLIPSKGNVKVAVMLQPFDYNAEEKTSKHKFMVQTAYVPEGESSLDSIWKNTDSSELMDSKLRVVFEMPEPTAVAEDNAAMNTASKPATTPQKQTSSMEADLRKAIDEKKRMQNDFTKMEQDYRELQERLRKLQSAPPTVRSTETDTIQPGGIKILLVHAVIAIVIALLLGGFLGKFWA